jgi:predicted GNAT superfamily acetyltransferase
VWGWDQAEIVPATLLHVVEYVGGVAAGAFDAQGTLLGFVFGITGPRDGELAHWSHMLGVRESARNIGVGRMLKEHQRSVLASRGVARVYWTFDPLMAKNAYLNLNRLGAKVVEYVPDMYGITASALHLGLATDRLVVCQMTNGRVATPIVPSTTAALPILTPFPRPDDLTMSPGDDRPPMVLLEIPPDILAVLVESPATAGTWRESVREHFRSALAHDYIVTGFRRGPLASRSFYILEPRHRTAPRAP